MTRWARNTTVFQVKLHKSKNRNATPSLVCRIPRPLIEMLGNPTSLRLYIEDDRVIMEGAENE